MTRAPSRPIRYFLESRTSATVARASYMLRSVTARRLTFTSAIELARMIRHREVSSLEVIDAHLRRIDEVNPRINAIVQMDAERARAEARGADDAIARGDDVGPLHGVPFTVKDWIEAEEIGRASCRERVGYA